MVILLGDTVVPDTNSAPTLVDIDLGGDGTTEMAIEGVVTLDGVDGLDTADVVCLDIPGLDIGVFD